MFCTIDFVSRVCSIIFILIELSAVSGTKEHSTSAALEVIIIHAAFPAPHLFSLAMEGHKRKA